MCFPMNCFGSKSDLHECMLKIMTQNTPGNDNSSLLSLNHRKCVIAHVAKKHLAHVASTSATLAQFIPIHPPTAKWQKKWHKNTFQQHTCSYTWHTTPKKSTVINYNRCKSVQYNTWMCVQGTWTSEPSHEKPQGNYNLPDNTQHYSQNKSLFRRDWSVSNKFKTVPRKKKESGSF